MNKKYLLFLLFCFCAALCGAEAGKKGRGPAPLVPPPIVSQWKEERLKVLETGEFSAIALPEKGSKAKKKANNSAALVSEQGKKFFWKPSPLLSSAIRSADLTGAALSADGSLAVIAERIGGEGKANSTRFLFFNIPERRLAGGFLLPEVLVSSIAFVPGSECELVGIRHRFDPYKVKDGLVKIDLREKMISDMMDSPAGKITSFVFGAEGKLFFTTEDSPLVSSVSCESLAVEPVTIKSRLSSPRIGIAGDTLIAYGKEGIEIFRPNQGRSIPDEKLYSFPESFQPVSCSVIDAAGEGFCFAGTAGEDLWYFRKGAFRKLKERVSGTYVWDETLQIFFAEVSANHRISLLQMPEAVENLKQVSPNRLKPASRNGSFALLRSPALGKMMLQIDSRGNVFLLDYARLTRWKKYEVYIADRAGFR